jgi:RNA polymerase sigma-70 factor (ECF subfamily)
MLVLYNTYAFMDNSIDSELVKRIREGDVLGFEQFVRRYQKRLWFFVSKILYSTSNVEEVVQDTLFSFYRSIEKVDTTKTISTYVFAIAKHAAIDRIRKEKKTVRLDDIDLAYEDETLYEQLTQKDDVKKVHEAMKKVTQPQERILRLYFFEELSYEEISRTLKMPMNTVRTNLRRAKAAIGKVL